MQMNYGSNKGKEKKSISYKLREIKEKQTKYQMNNNINNEKIGRNIIHEELKDMLNRVSKMLLN